MTFIYRQLTGVSSRFEPLVMATRLNNADHFQYDRLVHLPRGRAETLLSSALRGITGYPLPMFRHRRSFWGKVLRENNIELIHAHFGNQAIEILPLAKSLSIPLLVTFHGADASNMLRNPHYVKALGPLFDYAYVIAVSQTMAERLRRYGANPARMRVHYIGAPVEDFEFVDRPSVRRKSSKREEIVFLQVSNFVEKKGHIYTLEAFGRLLESYSNAKLLLAGDGPLREKVERRADSLGIADKVEFLGAVRKDRVIELMRASDVFVHHSVTAQNGNQEGLPTVLMEAMATGLPVVTTRHAGIPELVVDGENGFLVEERDIDGYAARLRDCLEADERIPLRAAATARERFNLQRQTRKLEKIYGGLLAGEGLCVD